MSSEEDEFFDAPDAFACSPYTRRWSDNEDDFMPTAVDFDNKNAQRRRRVESLKRSLVDHVSPPHFTDPTKDSNGRELRRVSLTDSRVFGLRTPTGIVRKHRSTFTHPHECFLTSTIPTIVAQDAVDRALPSAMPYSPTNETAVTYGALEGIIGLKSSPDHVEVEKSPLSTQLNPLLPLPVQTGLTLFPDAVFKLPYSRQYSLPADNAGRSQVISSAPEVSYSQITSDSNALMEYVKSWSLDAAKRQAGVVRSSRMVHNTYNGNDSRIPQFLGGLVSNPEVCDPKPDFTQATHGDQLVSGILSSPQTQSGLSNECGLRRSCRLVSTMVQTTSEDLHPQPHGSTQESSGDNVATLTSGVTQSEDKSVRLKSATLHDERTLNPIELHFRSLTTSNTSLPDAANLPGDTTLPQTTNASAGKVSRLQRYLRDAVSAVKSATRAKIFNQDEESSDEDEEVIGSQGIRLRSSRQAKGRREFLQVKLVQEMKNEHTGAIWAMRFSPCGRLLATAGYDRNIRIWVLRQWYSFFKRMQQRSVDSTSNPEFGSNTFMGSNFPSFENTTSAMIDDENLLDSISLASTSASTAGKTDDGTSTCSSNPVFVRHDRSSPTGGDGVGDAGVGAPHPLPGSHKVPDLERGRRTVFRSQPLLVYRGHEGVVTELAWSKNLFLLATSMDHQVRLWHISRRECLCLFSHNDTVPTVVFHPKDDRFFLSGSLDGKLRLWNIPDKKVRFWVEVPIPSALPVPANASPGPFTVSSLFKSTPPSTPQVLSATGHSRAVGPKTIITSATFACDGTKVVVGTYDGRVMFFNSELTYITFIAIKSGTTKGRQCRVTAIELDPTDSNKILVTSNDSRLRLIDARDYHTLCKYRGFVNETSQIRASFSPTGRYLISGSENAFFYIWQKSLEVDRISRFSRARKDRNHCWEAIKAHDTMVTAAIFCPNPNLVLDKHLRHGWFPGGLSSPNYVDAAHLPRLDELPSNADPRHPTPYLGELIVSADCNGCIRVFKKLSTSDSQASVGGSSKTQ